MKALVKFEKGLDGAELRDIKKQVPDDDELLVKIISVGICGTDIHILKDEYPCNMPVVLGHEYTGIIEQFGNSVTNFKEGDQIISSTAVYTCENCEYCVQGLRMLCERRLSIGSGINGAMAEYITVPAKLAYKVPDRFKDSYSIAAAEPLACAVRAVIEQSKIRSGDVVLISGPGPIGLFILQLAKLAGTFVIVAGIESDKERLDTAKQLGADVICYNPLELEKIIKEISYHGVDVAYECAGTISSINECINLLKKGGNLSQVGLFGKTVDLDIDKILCKELQWTVSFASEISSWDILLKILSQGYLDLDRIITDIFDLEEWRTALDVVLKKKGLKVLLRP